MIRISEEMAHDMSVPTFAETRRYLAEEICRVFDVPLYMLGITKPKLWGNPERFSS